MANFTGKTGLVKIGAAKTISAASHLTGVVTIDFTGAHGFIVGDRILISGVVGMTDLNTYHTVATKPDTDSVTVSLTTAQTYSSGGSVIRTIPVTSWKSKGQVGILPSTDSESGDYEESEIGRLSHDLTLEGYVKEGAAIANEGDSLTFKLEMDSTNYFTGTAVVETIEYVDPIQEAGIVTFTLNAKGTGAKTKTFVT